MTPLERFELVWKTLYEQGRVHPDNQEDCRAFFLAGFADADAQYIQSGWASGLAILRSQSSVSDVTAITFYKEKTKPVHVQVYLKMP